MPDNYEILFEALSAPNVSVANFLFVDLPSGAQRYHSGAGTFEYDGYEWTGITDPIAGQFVALNDIQDPRFGSAPVAEITLSVINVEFFKSIKSSAREIEGSRARLYEAAFDPETEGLIGEFKTIFDGRLSSPSLSSSGIGTRILTLKIESFFHAQNYPFGGLWNDANQQRRFEGDRGFEFTGVDVQETWR